MKIRLPYRQSDYIDVNIPDNAKLSILEPNNPTNSENPEDMIRKSLNEGGFKEFMELEGSPLVIVNDGTRATPTRAILDVVGKELEKAGASFIIATGVHRGPTQEEYNFIFGSWYDVFKDRIYVHDSKDEKSLEYLGTTENGTVFKLNRVVCQARKILIIGSVEPHYFAGYTGGRKAFLPGTAGFDSIEHNHSLALSEKSRALNLEDNPVHLDMMEAVSYIKVPVLSVMTVLNKENGVSSVTCGTLEKSFYDAVKKADEVFTVPAKEKADVVITVSKYPTDVDLYQAQKAIDNAKLVLKKGGKMILVASCREGIGGEAFHKLLSSSSTPQEAMESIRKNFKLGYHKAAKMIEVFNNAQVFAYTDLEDSLIESVFMTPVHDIQKVIDQYVGSGVSVAVLPDGSLTIPKIV